MDNFGARVVSQEDPTSGTLLSEVVTILYLLYHTDTISYGYNDTMRMTTVRTPRPGGYTAYTIADDI